MNWRGIAIMVMLTAGVVSLFLPLTVRAEMETYMIDKVHSMDNFNIRHLFSKVSGIFSDVTGTIWLEKVSVEPSRVEASVKAYRVDTNREKRDGHLLSSFFYVDISPSP